MKTVHIIYDPMVPTGNITVETDDVCRTCKEAFDEWPLHARIYHNNVDESNDVTPHCEADVSRLMELDGTFFIVNYPGDPVTILVGILINIVLAVAVYYLTPKPKAAAPDTATRDQTPGSPNNALTDRQNTVRLNGRIPDIYGQIRSMPDLIAPPYKVFANNLEVEHTLMCVGRGAYEINDVKDDTTLVSAISGESVEVYAPYTSSLNSDTPQYTVGTAITDQFVSAKRYAAVNGQTLLATNNTSHVFTAGNLHATYNQSNGSGTLTSSDGAINLSTTYPLGSTVVISESQFMSAYGWRDINGIYVVSSVDATHISFNGVNSINANWHMFNYDSGGGTISLYNVSIVGSFTVDVVADGSLWFNFIALNGIYIVNKTSGVQSASSVTISIGITPLDADGIPTGSMVTYTTTLTGSALNRDTVASTYKLAITTAGKYAVRAWRSSATQQGATYSGEDETKWRDLLVIAPIVVPNNHFGNVTTIRAVTVATAGALAIQERKLNTLVTRKLPAYLGSNTFSTELYATSNAADAFCAACLDTFIGRRDISELDCDNIYDTVNEVTTYFGHTNASEFCYTIDNYSTSFEEIIAAIAGAVFCIAYRRGSVIRLSFEKSTVNSTLLFNHRNKLPGSEERTVTFGYVDDVDGIEYTFISPDDDAIVTYYLPLDRSAINAKKIDSLGIRNNLQAYMHAWREWNKLRYQRVMTKFSATQEASLLVIQDRILVADNTRTGTQDGDVLDQNGLTLTLSQNVTFASGSYTIFIQYPDGTVGSMPVTAGSVANQVVLGQAPLHALQTADTASLAATYQIVRNDNPREHAFLVSEKTYQSNYTVDVTAVNYDARYYDKDTDYINSVIDLTAGM